MRKHKHIRQALERLAAHYGLKTSKDDTDSDLLLYILIHRRPAR